jgi:hypothetical protein
VVFFFPIVPLFIRLRNKERKILPSRKSTRGVAGSVTVERVILLDFEPFLSSSAVIDRGWAKPGPSGADKPGPFPSKRDAPGAPPPSLESTLDVQSFQLASLALAVCHVVVVVQDRILDPTLLR